MKNKSVVIRIQTINKVLDKSSAPKAISTSSDPWIIEKLISIGKNYLQSHFLLLDIFKEEKIKKTMAYIIHKSITALFEGNF